MNQRETLLRLKRKAARERTRYNKLYKTTSSPLCKERAFGESNVCKMFINWIDAELKKPAPNTHACKHPERTYCDTTHWCRVCGALSIDGGAHWVQSIDTINFLKRTADENRR